MSVMPPQDQFVQLWAAFYSQAVIVLDNQSKKANNVNINDKARKEQVQKILATTTKLIFGMDASKKTVAVEHAGGALELIVSLVNEYPLDDMILLQGLKAVKCCVIRNKAGRARCRSAGVVNLLSHTLESYTVKDSPKSGKSDTIVEEALTTLAAICLGDDINALQAAVQMQCFVEAATEQYGTDKFVSMHQKITYLKALFDIVRKENEDMLAEMESTGFFQSVGTAEREYRQALQCHSTQDFQIAQTHLDTSLELVMGCTRTIQTNLLNDLAFELYKHRADTRLLLKDYQGALEDIDRMKKFKEAASQMDATLWIDRIKEQALRGLGRKE